MTGFRLPGRRSTIAARLLAFSTVFVTLAVVVASVILWLIVAGVAREQIDQRLDTQIEALRSALATEPGGAVTLGASLDGPPFDRIGSGWYWEITGNAIHLTSRSLDGRTIDSPPRPGRHRPDAKHMARDTADAPDRSGPDLHVRTASSLVDGRPVEIAASAPQAALGDPARRALLWLVPAMAVLGAVLVVGTFLQVRYGLRPLKTLTSDIAAVAAGTLARLPDADAEELQPVAREINRLVDQNTERLAETRLHFANLAHGLKTPVASLSLALDAGNDPEGEMRELVERIDQRIRHHLARARKTMSGAGLGAATAIRPSIDDLVAVLSRIHADRGLGVHCDVSPGIMVACAGEDLEEVLGNVIDNAFKWASGTVRIAAREEARMIVILVADDGPGIAAETIEQAFRPGMRLDETVEGDGFGLTIAREVSELYGGSVVLENRSDGGLTVEIRLPRAMAAMG